MNKLDDVLISNDPAHKIEIYLDCGVYWKQVNPQLPATLHDIYLQYPNAVMIYVIGVALSIAVVIMAMVNGNNML